MSDLKEFWIKKVNNKLGIRGNLNVRFLTDEIRQDLGLFFWGRGGKQFVEAHSINRRIISELIPSAKTCLVMKNGYINLAQDFLDCVACLGEEKVKELIKELEGEKTISQPNKTLKGFDVSKVGEKQ